ncbi:MAG: hypothetical protein M3270_00330 [Thermoproteota archaeon]|nr:hypothetical protein [Thermoproteota archaeon]
MTLSPACAKWRDGYYYYSCRICKQNADLIYPMGLAPIRGKRKTPYAVIFGYKALEITTKEKEKDKKKKRDRI